MRCEPAPIDGLPLIWNGRWSVYAAMPSTTRCVHCGVVGYVRWERVITGTVTVVEYCCGNCDHVWRHREEDVPRPTRPDVT